ncbi:MAG TPA: alpha/beta fold hydrolase [Candidatus Anoxymicrobiaceae bacterium]
MSRLIHMRGDVLGMFLFLGWFLLGVAQVLVATRRLNGLSLTGYPDRRWASLLLGLGLAAGACAWYFSRAGHFASPDLEGTETLVVLVGGLVAAAFAQLVLAQIVGSIRTALVGSRREEAPAGEALSFVDGGITIPASYFAAVGAPGVPVLLLHDYGGTRDDVARLANALAAGGHAVLAPDLAGHGDNPQPAEVASLESMVESAAGYLEEKENYEAVSVVGTGLGGTLAVGIARKGLVWRAIAIDPPARDALGFADVVSFREMRPLDVLSSFLRPAARTSADRRKSLAKLLTEMPLPLEEDEGGHVTVIGTRGTWFNQPPALTQYTTQGCGCEFEPVFMRGRHATITGEEGTLVFLTGALE